MSKLVTIKVEASTRLKAKVYAAQKGLAVYQVVACAVDDLVRVKA